MFRENIQNLYIVYFVSNSLLTTNSVNIFNMDPVSFIKTGYYFVYTCVKYARTGNTYLKVLHTYFILCKVTEK